jgi:hypothetical protein
MEQEQFSVTFTEAVGRNLAGLFEAFFFVPFSLTAYLSVVWGLAFILVTAPFAICRSRGQDALAPTCAMDAGFALCVCLLPFGFVIGIPLLVRAFVIAFTGRA